MRILLVEDNPGDARLVREALLEVPTIDVELTVAGRLSDAGDELTDGSYPDVMLLDLGLPDASGLEAVTEIVRLAPGVPVVVLTGREDEEMGLLALREGAQEYLRKNNLDRHALVRAIRYAIERKRTQNHDRLLTEVGSLLASTLDFEEGLHRLSALAVRSLGDYCIIDMLGDDGTIRRLRATHRDPASEELTEELLRYPLTPGRSPFLESLKAGQTVRVSTVTPEHLESIAHDQDHLRILNALHPRSYIAVPLCARERLIGSILFISSSRSFDADDQTLAEKIGRIAAPELANAYLYKRAQEAIRARDRVLGIVAHDPRNPLNAISMGADLLLEPGISAEQRARQVHVIRRSTDRMNRLIQDLLDVARIESDRLQLHLEYQNPQMLAREAVELNTALADARGLMLHYKLGAGRPLPVRVDRDRILQVLSNLLANAVKFTPAGGQVTVGVEMRGAETCYSVTDTGPGIPAEDQAHLFTPFWQARRFSSEGAGLGLSIAKGIVEAHGGRIWLESTPGHGTTVFFTIPKSEERRSGARFGSAPADPFAGETDSTVNPRDSTTMISIL